MEAATKSYLGPGGIPDLAGARCIGNPFLPASAWTEPADSELGRAARFVCESCPVLQPCRQWALPLPAQTPVGILGGMSHNELRRERERLRREREAGDEVA